MSEELHQRDLIDNPEKIGKWDFRNIGSTNLNALKNAGIIPKKDYKNFERRKPDGIITSKKEVVAIVENKHISKFKTEKQKNKNKPGTMKWAAWIVARLGGWKGYESQHPPGPITFFKGL